jgi:hypothetical protein
MTTPKKLLMTAAGITLSAFAATTASAQMIFSQDFEGMSEGATSATIVANGFTIENGFNNRTDFWAVEGAGSNPAGTGNNGGDLFDATNTLGFGLRDLDDVNNPGTPNSITFAAIDTTGYTGLTFSFDLASANSVYNDNADTISVQFDLNYDGITFNNDETYNLTGTTNLGDGVLTSSASAFTNFSYTITGPVTGDLGLRIVATGFQDGGDQVTFDNIEIAAVPEPSTFALIGGFLALGLVLVRRRLRD